MRLERERINIQKKAKQQRELIHKLSKPHTQEEKRVAAKAAKKRERSRLNPIRCIIYFCTDPVARFWLLCNVCFVIALTTISMIYLMFIFPLMRGLFKY